MTQCQIETERIILRPWHESDAAALYKYACSPEVGPPAGWPPHGSVQDSLDIIRTVFSAPEVYAVVLKETGEPVGCCGLIFDRQPDASSDREAEIGYWIGRPYWGQGLIPEAVGALLARAFGPLGLDAVWCVYYRGNDKSKRVCEKCGFTLHHTNRDVASPLGDIRTEQCCILTRADYGNRVNPRPAQPHNPGGA